MALEDLLGTGFLPELDSRVNMFRRQAADPIGNARFVEGGFAPAGREGDVQGPTQQDFIDQIVNARFGGRPGETLKGSFGGQEFEFLRGQARPVFRGGFAIGPEGSRAVGQLGEFGRAGAAARVTDEQRQQAQAGLAKQAAAQDRLRTLLQAAILSSGGDPLAQRESIGKALQAFETSEQRREQFETKRQDDKAARDRDFEFRREEARKNREFTESQAKARREFAEKSEQREVSREEVKSARARQSRRITMAEQFASDHLQRKSREIMAALENNPDPAARSQALAALDDLRNGIAENLDEFIRQVREGKRDVSLFGIIRGFEGSGLDIEQAGAGVGGAGGGGGAGAPGGPTTPAQSLSQQFFGGKTPGEVVFGDLAKLQQGPRRRALQKRILTAVAGRSFGEQLGPDAGGLLTGEFRGGDQVHAVGRPTLPSPLGPLGPLEVLSGGSSVQPTSPESINVDVLIDAALSSGTFTPGTLPGRIKEFGETSPLGDPFGDIRVLIPKNQRKAVVNAIKKLDASGASREDIAEFLRQAMQDAVRILSGAPAPRPGEGPTATPRLSPTPPFLGG